MWYLSCRVSTAGVPFERTIDFIDASGVSQELQVDASNLESEAEGEGLLIVYPVEVGEGGRVLVTLPAETSSGQRRVWVHKSQLRRAGHDSVRS